MFSSLEIGRKRILSKYLAESQPKVDDPFCERPNLIKAHNSSEERYDVGIAFKKNILMTSSSRGGIQITLNHKT